MSELADAVPTPSNIRNIILIGYRGCGKTSAGRSLAEKLAWRFVDTDDQIERDSGRTIAEIFEHQGEATFRAFERDAIERVALESNCVIAVGGGAVVVVENREKLAAAGFCVWLTAPPKTLYARLVADERSATLRPALTDRPALPEIEQVLAQRTPLYTDLAAAVVDTRDRSIAQVVDAIIDKLSRSS